MIMLMTMRVVVLVSMFMIMVLFMGVGMGMHVGVFMVVIVMAHEKRSLCFGWLVSFFLMIAPRHLPSFPAIGLKHRSCRCYPFLKMQSNRKRC